MGHTRSESASQRRIWTNIGAKPLPFGMAEPGHKAWPARDLEIQLRKASVFGFPGPRCILKATPQPNSHGVAQRMGSFSLAQSLVVDAGAPCCTLAHTPSLGIPMLCSGIVNVSLGARAAPHSAGRMTRRVARWFPKQEETWRQCSQCAQRRTPAACGHTRGSHRGTKQSRPHGGVGQGIRPALRTANCGDGRAGS